MKKAILLIAVFTMIFRMESQAQINTAPHVDGQIYSAERDDISRIDRGEKLARKKQWKKRNKAIKKANKIRLKSMKKVAKADGVVTPAEKATIRNEKRKMKKAANIRKQKVVKQRLSATQE